MGRHTFLSVLTRYSVFTSENLLLVMRPYQIAATERILGRIGVATNYKRYGTVDGGGFIWHTTGSGKTLTSFKTAQLASEMAGVEKVLFVVDRKDLDYQTMKEYDRFEKGAANGNKSTKILARQLEDKDAKAINTESALLAPERVANIVSYTLEHFSQKTKRNAGSYTFSRVMNVAEVAQKNAEETKEKKRLKGFNAIFATASIDTAKAYYREFRWHSAPP